MKWIKLHTAHFKDFVLLAFGSVLNVGKAGNSHFYIQKVNLDVGSFFTSAGILVKDFQWRSKQHCATAHSLAPSKPPMQANLLDSSQARYSKV